MQTYIVVYQQVGFEIKEVYFAHAKDTDSAKGMCLNLFPMARIHDAFRIVKDQENEKF